MSFFCRSNLHLHAHLPHLLDPSLACSNGLLFQADGRFLVVLFFLEISYNTSFLYLLLKNLKRSFKSIAIFQSYARHCHSNIVQYFVINCYDFVEIRSPYPRLISSHIVRYPHLLNILIPIL